MFKTLKAKPNAPVGGGDDGAWQVCQVHFGMCCMQPLAQLLEALWQLITRHVSHAGKLLYHHTCAPCETCTTTEHAGPFPQHAAVAAPHPIFAPRRTAPIASPSCRSCCRPYCARGCPEDCRCGSFPTRGARRLEIRGAFCTHETGRAQVDAQASCRCCRGPLWLNKRRLMLICGG